MQSLRRTLSYYDLVIYGIAYVCPFGIFQSLEFVWHASNGLIVLAKIHPKHGTPYVGMLATTAISVTVALLMRYQMDELVSIVNFGALSGFLLLHVSVIARFCVKGRSGQWIVHLAVPVAGIIVVLAVLSGMSPLAMTLGIAWLIVGLVYGLILMSRRRPELAI